MVYIQNCLTSILNLNLPDAEIIVVDSGSKDGTVEYLWSLKNPSVKIIAPGRRLKWSEANEIGLGAARGDWLCLSNPDIEFNQGFVYMLEECDRDGLVAAAPQLILPDGYLQRPAKIITPWLGLCVLTRTLRLLIRKKHYVDYLCPYDPDGKERVRVDCPQGSLFMVHRSVLYALGGRLWNRGYQNGFSDLEAFLNIRRAGFQMWIFPQYRMLHYGSYVTKKYPKWIERDQARGFVLYFRYWARIGIPSNKLSPALSSLIFGLEGIMATIVEIGGRIVKRKSAFFTPRWTAWQAGERILGIIDGWRYKVD